MTNRPGSRVPILALAVVAMCATLLPAHADAGSRVIAFRGEYVPGDDTNHIPAVLAQGNSLVFVNGDPFADGPHTFTSDQTDALGNPIFDTGQVLYQQQVTVDVSSLPSGIYTFHCNVHVMFGTLCIEGADAPHTCTIGS